MVCVPITGIDKEAIQTFKNKTLKATYMPQPTSILDVPAPDALVLTVLEDTPAPQPIIPEVDLILSPSNTYIGMVQAVNGKSNISKITSVITEWLQDPDAKIGSITEGDDRIAITDSDETYFLSIIRTIPK